ncbi:hypothetical protein E1301_Tti019448 [Triplophysa tibetana]|uniref:C-type lectin domain-containing protein n=1 Tax=Triplophysa tibetana TaxID=1572043 RepID=A0A5A9PKT2_9TELE|nr:hypothetical protein E1301_Tti019448 [Triplophysa tibetana]
MEENEPAPILPTLSLRSQRQEQARSPSPNLQTQNLELHRRVQRKPKSLESNSSPQNKLILIEEKLSWTEAVRYCRENHVDLVSVVSEEIQLWAAEVAHEALTAEVWLGLRHSCSVGIWFWVNGEITCYQNWAPGNETAVDDCESEGRSGAVQSGGGHLWIRLPESKQLNFICSRYE